jgi:hypothetical protein
VSITLNGVIPESGGTAESVWCAPASYYSKSNPPQTTQVSPAMNVFVLAPPLPIR